MQPVYTISLNVPYTAVRYVVLEEDIEKGQRIESFRIYAQDGSGTRHPLFQGTCVGHKKICQLTNPFAVQNPLTNDMEGKGSRLILHVTGARGQVFLKRVRLYG